MRLIRRDNKKALLNRNSDLDTCKAASPSDCTGIIQVPPENEYEYDSYREVYDFTVPDSSDR